MHMISQQKCHMISHHRILYNIKWYMVSHRIVLYHILSYIYNIISYIITYWYMNKLFTHRGLKKMADVIFKRNSLIDNDCIWIQTSLYAVSGCPINNKSAVLQIMACAEQVTLILSSILAWTWTAILHYLLEVDNALFWSDIVSHTGQIF